uniref:Helitron helicase-like domain-containing protein n=1 Tax=Lactuca sativa TaxID=4236 RepID=A0A9R1W1N7_LACSA|nr:hypothetical protein LSAT_V11C300132550 [Lactuca sativa]
MQQTYLDTMTLVKWLGFLELLLSLTCNPKWPEVIRFVEADNLKPEDRPNTDHVICVEFFDKDIEPDLYQIVCDNMIYGPCGIDQLFMSCMKKGKCSKRFPKEFTKHTYIDADG